jgi:hypothetical protein
MNSNFSPEQAGSSTDRGALSISGQPAPPLFADSTGFRRPRFLVLPTGRTIFAWGIWDAEKNPLGSIPTCIFKMSDFVSRHRNLGLAYKAARKLNQQSERKAVA